MPKLHDKAIIRLDTDEVALLLDFVESAGEHLTGQALNYYKKTRDRDIAILTLLLGTGIRVSECVGLQYKGCRFSRTMELWLQEKGGRNQMVVISVMRLRRRLKIIWQVTVRPLLPSPAMNRHCFVNTEKTHGCPGC